MKLDEITKVKQTIDENEVNEYLAKGYRIIKILSSRISNQFGGEEIKPVYVLGLIRENAK
jgi:hypothetical protein